MIKWPNTVRSVRCAHMYPFLPAIRNSIGGSIPCHFEWMSNIITHSTMSSIDHCMLPMLVLLLLMQHVVGQCEKVNGKSVSMSHVYSMCSRCSSHNALLWTRSMCLRLSHFLIHVRVTFFYKSNSAFFFCISRKQMWICQQTLSEWLLHFDLYGVCRMANVQPLPLPLLLLLFIHG